MTVNNPIYPLDTEALRQKSIRGAAATSGAQVAKFFILLASQVVLARLLDPADFGIVAMVAPIFGFVTVMADLGIGQAIVQRPLITQKQLNAVFWVNNSICTTMALILMASAPLLGRFYNEPKLVPVTLALAVIVIISGVSIQQTAILNRTMRFSILAFSETLSQALGFCASVLGAMYGLGYWSLVAGQAAAALTGLVIVWSASSWRPGRPSFAREAVSMLRFGGSISVSNVALYLNSVLDNVLVGYFLGAVLLGIYDRAWKLAVLPLSQLMAPINRIAIPALSRLADDGDRFRSAFGRMYAILLFVSLPGLAIGIVAARPLIDILFGAKWAQVPPVFAWLCLGSLLTPTNAATFWLFVSQGRSRDQMIYGTAAAVINIMTYAVGIQWGLLGVTRTSSVVAYLLTTPLLVWAATRTGHVKFDFLLKVFYPFVLSTVGCAASIWLFKNYAGIHGLFDIVVAAAVAYGSNIAILSCFPQGRATMKSAIAMSRSLVVPTTSRI